jgi:hypothetical protein
MQPTSEKDEVYQWQNMHGADVWRQGRGLRNLLPVTSKRWPRFAAMVLITVVVAMLRHVFEGPRDGRLAAVEDNIGRGLPGTRIAAARSTVQARAGPDCRQPVTAKTRVLRAVCVTPLPSGVMAGSQVFNVTRRRQGRRDLLACSWNGHGDRGGVVRGAVVVRQCVVVGLIYPNARGAAGRRHCAFARQETITSPETRLLVAAEAWLAAHERRGVASAAW